MVRNADELSKTLRRLGYKGPQALELCEQYVREHPDDANGLFSRFQVLQGLGENKRALADIDRVLEIDPNSTGYSARGAFFHGVGDYQRAIDDLARARELDAEEWEGSFDPHFRADSYARLGRLDEALADGHCAARGSSQRPYARAYFESVSQEEKVCEGVG
jgi:tetratricopeptide (TPR) repeat protein